MAHTLTLWPLAVLSILGGGIGMHLGRSTIAEINPVYFEPTPTRFHADLVSNRPLSWDQAPETGITDASLIQGLGTGCVLCPDYPEEYHPIPEPAMEGYEEEASEPVRAADEEYRGAGEAPGYANSQAQLYAYYAITEPAAKDRGEVPAVSQDEATLPVGSEDPGAIAP